MNTPYLWDETLHLYRRETISPFAYTDGADVEARILSIVQAAKDRSTFSEELISGITDWPSEYHLSRSRHVLIRPLGIQRGDTVLELGCGCGAITRYLGEIGAKVTAVEGSVSRARIAAARCIDLDNVRVVVDDLQCVETTEQFDWVLLIGVLEYAPLFSDALDPARAYLAKVVDRLKPDGRLVIAIENRFGLKYFNGCAEDHLGEPFVGVQDLYGAKTARTYGHQELEDKLHAAGLKNQSFLYPFPDYKLPSVILREAALEHRSLNVGDLLARATARDYSGQQLRLFDESLTWPGLARNRILRDMSNSFLIVASRDGGLQAPATTLAHLYSVHRRAPFATHTEFVDRSGQILLHREHILEDNAGHEVDVNNVVVTHTTDVGVYFEGSNLVNRFLKVQASDGSLPQMVSALSPWFSLLLERADSCWDVDSDGRRKLESAKISGNFLDLTPFNLIEANEELCVIDQEWRSNDLIPLGWLAVRGITYTLGLGLALTNTSPTTSEVLSALCAHFDIDVMPTSVDLWIDQEIEFQRATMSVAQQRTSLTSPTPYRSGLAALRQANSPVEIQLDRARAREQEISHALSLREAAYNDRVAEIDGLQEHVRELNELLSQSRKASNPSNANLDRSEIEALTVEVQHLHAELKTRQRALDQLEISYAERVKEVQGLSALNARLEDEIEQQSTSRLHISGERDAALRELDRVRTESALLNKKFASLTDEFEALSTFIEHKTAAYQSCMRDMTASTAQIAQLTQQADALRQANAALEDSLGNSQRSLRELQAEVGRLLTSRSWRITRPLRVLGRLSRGEWSSVRTALASRLRRSFKEPAQPAQIIEQTESAQPIGTPTDHAPLVNTAPLAAPMTRHRILLVSYYCPTRAHAGGLRILDIYSLIREKHPEVQLDLYTHHRPAIDWSLDDVHRIFDRVYLSPTEDLALSGLNALAGTLPLYDVVDLQFHQSAYHLDAFRAIAKKILFTPMESLTKVLFIDLRNRANFHGEFGIEKMAGAMRLASEEITLSTKADEVICVSRADAAFLRAVTGSRRIKGLDTGVSLLEFAEALRPDHPPRSAAEKECRLLYVAYFGSETNVTALRWYLDHVHPIVKAQIPNYILSVVGRGDLSSFAKYRDESIEFIGEVPSIAPHIESARVGIAPALGGSGFRGKVNQYAVLGVPSVVTSIALKGLAYQDGVSIFVADAPDLFAQRCVELLTDMELNQRLGTAARRLCMERYSWQSKWKAISSIYNLGGAK